MPGLVEQPSGLRQGETIEELQPWETGPPRHHHRQALRIARGDDRGGKKRNEIREVVASKLAHEVMPK